MKRFFDLKLDHATFWAATVLFHFYTRISLLQDAGATQLALEVLVRNGLLAVIIYLNFLIAVPGLLKQKKYALYIAAVLGLLVFYVAAKGFHDYYLYGITLHHDSLRNIYFNLLYNFSIGLFYLAFSTTLLLSKEWFIQRDELQQLRIENLNTELQYLKQQINPHFLFNTINSIYFQISRDNQEARETLHKFSELLRYPLYESNGKTVAIEKEINYLRNFVELHQIRKNDNYQIQFSSRVANPAAQIYPLLLSPFVENAFKHCSHYENDVNEIKITIEEFDDFIFLDVYNSKEARTPDQEAGGIGIANAKRRLDLLYKENYQLDISDEALAFHVRLKLPILKS